MKIAHIILMAILFGIVVPGFRIKARQAEAVLSWSERRKPTNSPDPRIKKALEKLKLDYKITDSGDFRVSLNIEDEGRMQYVFIDSDTYTLGSMELRRIWSAIAIFPKTPPANVMNQLLEAGSTKKLGGYQMVSDKDGSCYITFFHQIDADTPPDFLLIYLKAVALPADEAEKELTGNDNF